MKFSKMHGIGNDYVYVNCFEEQVSDPEATAIAVSDRRKGIGSDGLILILPSDKADCRMRIFNADGSEAMMCGNGIRCVGKYAYDHGIVNRTELSVETNSGIKYIRLRTEQQNVVGASVDMGTAVLQPAAIPMLAQGEQFISETLHVNGTDYKATAVSMGNPHCVLLMEADVRQLPLEELGPAFEHHALFPERVNTEFINVLDNHTLRMRVWERGSGETMACGTGACAAAVASVLNGCCRQEETITVQLLGGTLEIVYHTDGTVTMTGPATHVFDGVWLG